MAILTRIGVDWDQDLFFCWEARPDDPLNKVTSPVDWTGLPFAQSGTGAGGSTGGEITDYGLNARTWTSGTSSNGSTTVGNTSTRLADGLTASTAYTLVLWIKSNSASYDAVPLDITVFDQAANSLATSANFTVLFADGWTKIAVNFSTGVGDTGCYFTLRKDTSTTNAVYKLTGFMVIPGTYTASSAPEFNAGDESNYYDNLVPYALDAHWNVGARDAYVNVADLNVATLTLNNYGQEFSPENSASPLYGIMADKKVQIRLMGPSSTSYILKFTGWIESVQPVPGINTGPYTAVLRATSSRRYYEGKRVRISLLTSTTADAVITAITGQIDLPDGIGLNTSLDAGAATWPYAGDSWEEGVDPLQAIADVAASERGFVYWSKDDILIMRNRAWRYDTDDQGGAVIATFTDKQESMEYTYGEDIYNDIEVTYYPRKVGSAGTTLFELDEDIALAPLESETLICRYTKGDQNAKPCGGSGVTVGTFTGSGTLNHSDTFKAQSAEILVTNPSAVNTRTLTALILTGTPIIAQNSVAISREDATSVTNYGRRTMKLDLPLVATRSDAKTIALLELARFKDPRGRVKRMTIGQHDTTNEHAIAEYGISTKITVVESQTVHNSQYIIMGEENTIDNALKRHRVTWTLEPVVDLI